VVRSQPGAAMMKTNKPVGGGDDAVHTQLSEALCRTLSPFGESA